MKLKSRVKGIYSKCKRFLYKIAINQRTKRNYIILVDNLSEPRVPPMDNYTLFLYLEEHNSLPLKPIYIISNKSVYSKQIKKQYGKHVLCYNNYFFFFAFLNILTRTRYICDSFQNIDKRLYYEIRLSNNITSIFTQHGVNFFKEDFITKERYGHNIFDKVLVSNNLEKNLFVSRGGYNEGDIIKDGLFRWDLLSVEEKEKPSFEIFIYFTYRSYLGKVNSDDLLGTNYFSTILDMLQDERIITLKQKYNFTIKISLHHILLNKLDPLLLKEFTLVDENEIGEEKKNADLLVTDYSSMCFEFMHQDKPVIFYKINDEDAYIENEQSKDIINPYENKHKYLYRFVSSLDEYIDELEKIAKIGFQITEVEKSVYNEFFYYKDNYCKRFIEALIENNDI